jgi:hypothetical protein
MELRPILRTLVFASGLLLAATAHAQDRGMTPLAGFGAHDTAPARAESPRYGTTGLTYVRVPGIEFLPEFGSYQDFSASSLERHPLSSSDMRAPLHLPGGAIIDYLEIDFYDLLDPEDIQLFIVNCGSLGDFCHNVANINSFANPGYGAISTSGINYQVDNLLGSLALKAIFGANSPNLTLVGAIVVRGRAHEQHLLPVHRGSGCLRNHVGLRRFAAPVLSGPANHARRDGRLPGQGPGLELSVTETRGQSSRGAKRSAMPAAASGASAAPMRVSVVWTIQTGPRTANAGSRR